MIPREPWAQLALAPNDHYLSESRYASWPTYRTSRTSSTFLSYLDRSLEDCYYAPSRSFNPSLGASIEVTGPSSIDLPPPHLTVCTPRATSRVSTIHCSIATLPCDDAPQLPLITYRFELGQPKVVLLETSITIFQEVATTDATDQVSRVQSHGSLVLYAEWVRDPATTTADFRPWSHRSEVEFKVTILPLTLQFEHL